MKAKEETKILAEIVKGIINGLHDAAPECCQCPIQGTDACTGWSDAITKLNEIIEG